MTYEELQKQVKAIERKEKAFSRKCGKDELKLKQQYIDEHKPIEVKRFQRLMVRLRVTEKSRERMGEKYRDHLVTLKHDDWVYYSYVPVFDTDTQAMWDKELDTFCKDKQAWCDKYGCD